MNNLFVFDTNILISASLIGNTQTSKALDKGILSGTLCFSDATIDELIEVLFRSKFDKYFINETEKWDVIYRMINPSNRFNVTEVIAICRDPKDNKFLELAVSANASCIITGDKDLLELNPFRGIPILNPIDFLKIKF